jgi:hypothetical protein
LDFITLSYYIIHLLVRVSGECGSVQACYSLICIEITLLLKYFCLFILQFIIFS